LGVLRVVVQGPVLLLLLVMVMVVAAVLGGVRGRRALQVAGVRCSLVSNAHAHPLLLGLLAVVVTVVVVVCCRGRQG
jgi:hypothetical protein